MTEQWEDQESGWKAQSKRLGSVEKMLKKYTDKKDSELINLRKLIMDADKANAELSIETRAVKEEKRAWLSNKQSLETKLKSAEAKSTHLAADLILEKQLCEKVQVELDQVKRAAHPKSPPPREEDPIKLTQEDPVKPPQSSRNTDITDITGDKPIRESASDDLSPTQTYPSGLLICCEERAHEGEEVRTVFVREHSSQEEAQSRAALMEESQRRREREETR